MKSVFQNYFENVNAKIAVFAGILGGMGKFILLQINSEGFLETLLKASITALFCGLAGVAGKEVFSFLKAHITVRFKKKK